MPSRYRFLRWPLLVAAVAAVALLAAVAASGFTSSDADADRDPMLRVSPTNPRYFSVRTGNHETPVYLAGANLWNNVQDGPGLGTCDEPGPAFDWTAYLDFLESHHLNFVRGWRWEHFQFKLPNEFDPGGPYCVSPHPWLRTGPETAYDGGPRFDLASFDESYFDRLRARILEAGERDMYVSVMLFETFCLHICDDETQIGGHPFDAQNNINGIDIDSYADYASAAVLPDVKEIQRAYIRHVIDKVHDLDNILYEVANEGFDSVEWQYDVITYVKEYETAMGYQQHPVGMSSEFPEADNDDLWASPADWIMPGTWPPVPDDYANDPPEATGAKVVISDSDHYLPCETTPLWAWKSLARGLNASMLDCGIGDPSNPVPDFFNGSESVPLEPTRVALGETRRQARKMELLTMEPRGDLSSTGYALANPGNEYLIVQPDAATFTVELTPGTYTTRWFDIDAGVWKNAGKISIPVPTTTAFTAPFASPGPTVLYLKRSSG